MASGARFKGLTEEEDASVLKLGSDFSNCECLLVSEVKILLEAQKEAKLKENKTITNIHQKTLAYAQQFGRFTNQDSVREVRK
ncbi:DNA-directed RNA polymerase II subunit 4 [Smittium culicis]|uniref:DNA-directed RNA polymerase II subunit 4 n=1 Tax=Smittium culicis TaxID=133412 RepID=A0A1R1YRW5_9FUNG|nr:DNA-directed RNA polymerase II subunit 4 [Smittium culicis]